MEILMEFISTEITDDSSYRGIMNFIISENIRNGEYKGKEYVIKKMDLINFIIFPEYEYGDGMRAIQCVEAIFKDILILKINEYAEENGIEPILE